VFSVSARVVAQSYILSLLLLPQDLMYLIMDADHAKYAAGFVLPAEIVTHLLLIM